MNVLKVKYSKKELFCLIMFMSFVLSNITDLYYSAGYLSIFSCICGIIIYKKNLRTTIRNWILIVAAAISLILFLMNTQNVLEYGESRIAIVIFANLCIFSLLCSERGDSSAKAKIAVNSGYGIEDILYGLLFIFCILSLYRYYLSGGRDSSFIYGQQYVSFSVIIMFLFLFGIKLNHRLMSTILAVVTCIVLPSRTFQFFILLYIICRLFSDKIEKILQKRAFNSSLKIITWLFVGTMILAYIWVFVLGKYIQIYDGHGESLLNNMYDASNFGRFGTYIYALAAIFQEKPFFKGIGELVDYETLVDMDGVFRFSPHNSYLQLLIFYSIVFGILVIVITSKIIDKYMYKENIPFIIPYLFITCILHDLLTTNLSAYLLVLFMDQKIKVSTKEGCKLCLK